MKRSNSEVSHDSNILHSTIKSRKDSCTSEIPDYVHSKEIGGILNNISTEERAEYNPCVINPEPICSESVNMPIQQGPIYAPCEVNRGFDCPESISTQRQPGHVYAPFQINHDHFRFAYDLVELVLQIRGELNPNVPRNLPEPENYIFSDTHAQLVKSSLEMSLRDATSLLHEIYSITHGVYEYGNYLSCRNYYAGSWTRRAYTEKAFIYACASIAYVAAHFIQINWKCGALDDAIFYIACWVGDILQRGTIAQSSWGL